MALIRPTRTAQWPLMAEFTWNWDDTMTNQAGTLDEFKTAAAHVFEPIPLPINAVVVGGDLTVETTFATVSTYAIIVGDSGSTNRYLGTSDYKAAGRTALVPTGYVGTGENIRMTITPTGSTATAGKATLRVLYTIRSRSNENTIT